MSGKGKQNPLEVLSLADSARSLFTRDTLQASSLSPEVFRETARCVAYATHRMQQHYTLLWGALPLKQSRFCYFAQ